MVILALMVEIPSRGGRRHTMRMFSSEPKSAFLGAVGYSQAHAGEEADEGGEGLTFEPREGEAWMGIEEQRIVDPEVGVYLSVGEDDVLLGKTGPEILSDELDAVSTVCCVKGPRGCLLRLERLRRRFVLLLRSEETHGSSRRLEAC